MQRHGPAGFLVAVSFGLAITLLQRIQLGLQRHGPAGFLVAVGFGLAITLLQRIQLGLQPLRPRHRLRVFGGQFAVALLQGMQCLIQLASPLPLRIQLPAHRVSVLLQVLQVGPSAGKQAGIGIHERGGRLHPCCKCLLDACSHSNIGKRCQ